MKKILIIGNCGVGKTTFSKKLAHKLKIPLIHLDQHYWKPNWERPSAEEWTHTVVSLTKGKAWIIEGNYKSSLHIRIPACDTIIFLDYPRVFALWRAIKRYLQSMYQQRPEINNNREKIDLPFLKWILTYPRKEMLLEIEKYTKKQKLIVIKSPKELAAFLKSC